MTDNAEGVDAILNGLQEAIAAFTESPAVVATYVVVASWIAGNGERHVYFDTMEGQRAHESLGLLDFAQAHERGLVAHHAIEDDE